MRESRELGQQLSSFHDYALGCDGNWSGMSRYFNSVLAETTASNLASSGLLETVHKMKRSANACDNNTPPSGKHLPGGLAILHEDRDIIVVDKPAGLLTISTEREKSRTAYFILTDYVRKGVAKSRNRIFIVHRLDRETSGILIFAKNEEAKFRLQSQWQDTKKQYLAVVHGRCEKHAETITTYLAENQAHGVYTTSDARKGKLSHTAYRVLKADQRLFAAGSRSFDRPQAPDPRASRRHRPPGGRRRALRQRT